MINPVDLLQKCHNRLAGRAKSSRPIRAPARAARVRDDTASRHRARELDQ